MLDILMRACCFIAIILLGILLKKVGLFKDTDFSVLSAIVLKITLPASIIVNFANKDIDFSLFSIILLGLGFGLIYVLLGFSLNRKNTKEQRAFEILNLPGYNIGCFALPFVQSFLGPTGVIATCLFDIGNAFVCLGGSFSIAKMVKDGGRFSFKRIIKALSKSIPFLLYIIMITLCISHVPIPHVVTEFAEIIANANAFLAMFMIGVGFKLAANKAQIRRIFEVVSVRYAAALVFALLIYYVLPFSGEVQKTLMLLVFSPIGAAVPPFTEQLGGDIGLSSAINSICIVCSIVFMVLILGIVP